MTVKEFTDLPWKKRHAYDKKLKEAATVHMKRMIEKIHKLNPIETELFKNMLIEKIELYQRLRDTEQLYYCASRDKLDKIIDMNCRMAEKIEQFIAESFGMKKTYVVEDRLAVGITYDESDQMAPTVMFKDILDAV